MPRREALQGALDALGPRPVGRPARDEPPEAARIRELEAQVGNLGEEVHGPRTRRGRQECVRGAGLLRWMIVRRGRTLEDVAHRLWLRPRTLRRWLADWRARKRAAKPRGRPASTVTREQRQTVRAVLALTGLAVSLGTLRLLFPDLTRAVLVDLKRRLRRALRRRWWVSASVLCGTKAGAVRSMDFAEPPTPIDGEYG